VDISRAYASHGAVASAQHDRCSHPQPRGCGGGRGHRAHYGRRRYYLRQQGFVDEGSLQELFGPGTSQLIEGVGATSVGWIGDTDSAQAMHHEILGQYNVTGPGEYVGLVVTHPHDLFQGIGWIKSVSGNF